jgi:hypothetical protein
MESTKACPKAITAVSLAGPCSPGWHNNVSPLPPIPANRASEGAFGVSSPGVLIWKEYNERGFFREGVLIFPGIMVTNGLEICGITLGGMRTGFETFTSDKCAHTRAENSMLRENCS